MAGVSVSARGRDEVFGEVVVSVVEGMILIRHCSALPDKPPV